MSVLKRSLQIAWPVMLANTITPLIGLIDSVLMGRLPDAVFGAAVGVAAMVVGYIVFGCNFLTFSMSGLSANAKGENAPDKAIAAWQQHALIALAIGLFVALSQVFWRPWLLALIASNGPLIELANQYLSWRLLNAPIILLNLCFIGFFIGQGLTRINLYASVGAQVANILVSSYLVLLADWNILGVAIGSMTAEWLMFAIYFGHFRHWSQQQQTQWHRRQARYMSLSALRSRGSALWLRGLVLTSSVAALPWVGASFGNTAGASVTILLNLFLLSSSLLDGFAQATEAQLGSAIRQPRRVQNHIMAVNASLLLLLAALLVLGYQLIASGLIPQLTKVVSVQLMLAELWPFFLLMIVGGSTAFFLDGVFIGLNKVRHLRNAVVFPALVFYFPALLMTNQVTTLLLCFAAFLLIRSAWLAAALVIERRQPCKQPI